MFLQDWPHAPLNKGALTAELMFHLLKQKAGECSFEITTRSSHQSLPADAGAKGAAIFGGKTQAHYVRTKGRRDLFIGQKQEFIWLYVVFTACNHWLLPLAMLNQFTAERTESIRQSGYPVVFLCLVITTSNAFKASEIRVQLYIDFSFEL